MICKFCQKICKNQNSLIQHQLRCLKNENRIPSNFTKYNMIRSDTGAKYECKHCHQKFEDSRVLGGHTPSCKLNPHYENNKLKFIETARLSKGRKLTLECRNKISIAAKKGLKNGTWHTGNSWVGIIEYNSHIAGKVFLMGKWELEYAKYLDCNNIRWIWNQERFKYESDELPTKTGYYKPDFYLIDSDTYVEVKGYETKLDSDKWKCFPKKLKILRGKDLLELGLKIAI